MSTISETLNTKSDIGHNHSATDITSGSFGTDRISDKAITVAKLSQELQNHYKIKSIGVYHSANTGIGVAVGAYQQVSISWNLTYIPVVIPCSQGWLETKNVCSITRTGCKADCFNLGTAAHSGAAEVIVIEFDRDVSLNYW